MRGAIIGDNATERNLYESQDTDICQHTRQPRKIKS